MARLLTPSFRRGKAAKRQGVARTPTDLIRPRFARCLLLQKALSRSGEEGNIVKTDPKRGEPIWNSQIA